MRIGELARRTGVGVSTLRAWERRFHFPVPERSASGQRSYVEADIERVDAVLRLMSEGLTLPAAITRVANAGPGVLPDGEAGSLLLRQILEAADQGVWVSKDGRTLFANRRMADMMGYSVDELIGIPVLDFFAPEDLPAVRERTVQIRAGEHLHFTTRLRRADGTFLLADVRTTPLLSPARRYDGAVAVVVDAAARREAEIHARVRGSLLDAVGEAVMVTTPEGTIVYLNSEAEQLFGWKSSEVVGREAITQLAAPQSAEDAERILLALLEGKRYVGPQIGNRRDGTTFAAHVTAWSVRDDDDQIVGLAAIIRDHSDRVQHEQDARRRRLQAETLALLGVQLLRQRSDPRGADVLLTEAVEAIRRLLDADRAAAFEMTVGQDELTVRTASPSIDGRWALPTGSRSFAGYTALARHVVVVDNIATDHRFDPVPMLPGGPGASAIGAPIFAGADGIAGVLVAESSMCDQFDSADAHFVQSVANLIASALAT